MESCGVLSAREGAWTRAVNPASEMLWAEEIAIVAAKDLAEPTTAASPTADQAEALIAPAALHCPLRG